MAIYGRSHTTRIFGLGRVTAAHNRSLQVTAFAAPELANEADLLNSVDTDEHEQRLTETRGVIEAQRRHAARLRDGLGFKLRLVQ